MKYRIINHATNKKIIVEAKSAQEAAKKVGYRIKEVPPMDIGQPKLSGISIAKAREILTDLLRDQPTWPPDDRREAVKLGIEALKCIQVLRIIPDKRLNLELPGETQE